MPTFTAANPGKFRRASGWTLIEVLVVVVIIAIVASMALLSLSVLGDDRDLETEGRRFAALFETALDEAALQGREYGIELMDTAYRFVEFDALTGVWVELPNDPVLRTRQLPNDMYFELHIEDKRVLLDPEPAELDDPEKIEQQRAGERYSPHLFAFSSGDASPFELDIVRDWDERRYQLRGDALGAIEFGEAEE